MIDRRAKWRIASKKYWDSMKISNPDLWKAQIKKIYKRNLEYRFGGNRQKVLERDNYSCQVCGAGKDKRLSVHHIDNKGMRVPPKERNHSMDNLVTLCQTCHCTIQNFAVISHIPLTKELVSKYLSN